MKHSFDLDLADVRTWLRARETGGRNAFDIVQRICDDLEAQLPAEERLVSLPFTDERIRHVAEHGFGDGQAITLTYGESLNLIRAFREWVDRNGVSDASFGCEPTAAPEEPF